MSIDIYDSTVDDGNAEFFGHVESLQDTLNEYHQSFIKDTVISPAVSQELHSLISAMATFDSASNERDFMVTDDSSFTQPLLTSSY